MVDRAAQWSMIKSDAPDLAALMVDLADIFGKPSAVRIELAGVVIEHGRFSGPRVGVDVSSFRSGRYGR